MAVDVEGADECFLLDEVFVQDFRFGQHLVLELVLLAQLKLEYQVIIHDRIYVVFADDVFARDVQNAFEQIDGMIFVAQ